MLFGPPPRPGPVLALRDLDDILRAVDAGIRGFLIPDRGLLQLVRAMVDSGELPKSIVWKISAVLAPSNPAPAPPPTRTKAWWDDRQRAERRHP